MQHVTKSKLIESGLDIMREKGFNHTGLQEVLARADVPKGSFYHFFTSKEDFGEQVLEHYAQMNQQMAEQILLQDDVPPLQRMRQFFEQVILMCQEGGCTGGCLIGNLSQEMADQSPRFAQLLARKWSQQRELFRSNLEEAQTKGDLKTTSSASDMADYLINGWQGALMRMKVTHTSKPLEQFMDITFSQLLA